MRNESETGCAWRTGSPHGMEKFDLGTWMREQVERTPWWAVSVVFHSVIILLMASISMGNAGEVPPIDGYIVRLPPPVPPAPTIEELVLKPSSDIPDVPTPEQDELAETEQSVDPNPQGPEEHEPMGNGLEGLFNRDMDRSGDIDVPGVGGGRFGGEFGNRPGPGGPGGPGGNRGDGDGRGPVFSTIRGLAWLARHQNPEGYWDCDGFHSQCKGTICDGPGYPEYNVGVTGLALLAFLGAGYTHKSKDVIEGCSFGRVVVNGLKWLQSQQDTEGLFGGKSGAKYMYNHALGTLAMCEAYGMTQSPLFERSARRAVEYLMRAQTKYRGWRYDSQPRDNDMSVTGWCVMALKSAELAGFQVGMAGYQGALNLVNELTEDLYFRVGYQSSEDAGTQVSEKGKNDHYMNHGAMTAIGMLIRMYTEGNPADPILSAQARILMQDLPEWNKKNLTNDYYYWYYATLALFMYDGPDSGSPTQKYWKEWNKSMLVAIRDTQRKKADKCAEGSWDADDRWGFEGGRVYATAINTLTLEVYYRYPNVFSGAARRKTCK
ncbi:MAG: terpene cyclase/mutase family protein [Planctomycetota bacterium]|nr:terpene cyclase/mutase family protein [Planctomycetota bacterium]